MPPRLSPWRNTDGRCSPSCPPSSRCPPMFLRGRSGAQPVDLSMGGMLAFDVAGAPASPGPWSRVACSTPRTARCGADAVRRVSRRSLPAPTPWGSDRLPVPMPAVAPVPSVARDPDLSRTVAGHREAGGTWMPAGWLRTYLDPGPAVAPEDLDLCPVVTTNPVADTWTTRLLNRWTYGSGRAASSSRGPRAGPTVTTGTGIGPDLRAAQRRSR